MTGEGKIKSIDNNRFRNNGGINIVKGSVDRVPVREGVSRGHLGTGEDFPYNIKILEEEGPVSLATR